MFTTMLTRLLIVMTENELLPTRLNGEPTIFRGCSLSELTFLTVIGAAIWIPAWLLIAGFFGYLMMGVGVGVLSIIAWVFVCSTILQRLKRNKPNGYYQLSIRLFLEDKGLIKSKFIRESRVWDIGRSL